MTLHERVAREARALAWRARVVHVAIPLAAVIAVLAVGAWALTDGRWLAWPRAVPAAVWLGAAALALVAWRRVTRQVPTPPVDRIASGIEAEQGLRPGSLTGALELGAPVVATSAARPGHVGSRTLAERAVADVERRLGTADVLLPRARREAGRRLVLGGGLALMALAVLGVASARARDGVAAVLHPLAAYRGLLLEPLAFEGLPTEVPRGMPLTVVVRAPGRTRVMVSRRASGAAWTTDTLAVDPATLQATLALGPVRAPLTVRVEDGRAPSLERDVAVGDRGWIGDLVIDARYPAYLARPEERLDLASGIRVPRGTVLRVQAATYAGARDVRLLSADGDTVAFVATGTTGTGDGAAVGAPLEARVEVQADGRWQWAATPAPGVDGRTLPVELPEPIDVAMIPDDQPVAELIAPASDTTVAPSGSVRLVVGASDDHGLAEVALLVSRERAGGTREAPVRVLLERPGDPLWEGEHALRLDGRRLEAGDRLVVEAEAVDASPWRQRGRSRPLVLRVPTASEQRTIARSLADSLMARADALAEAERALQRSTTEAARSRELQGGGDRSNQPNASEGARSQSMSYERAEQMRSLAQQQRDLGDRVEELKQGARELEQRLDASGAMDKALQERFRELQQMLREAMTPEMQQRLAELGRNAERLSGSDVRQSLEQLAAQQRQMREQLEKSAEMLKRAALEGAMETLRDEAQELAREERALADALAKERRARDAEPGARDARDARELASRSERLERDVEQLTERLRREGASAGAAKTQEAQPDVEAAREAMQRAVDAMRGRPEAEPGQSPQAGQPQAGQPQAGQPQAGQPQAGQQQAGQQQAGQQQAGQQQAGQPQPGQRRPGQPQPGQPQPGQPQPGQQPPGAQPSAGQQPAQPSGAGQQGAGQAGAGEQAQRAAEAMERAAEQLAAARDAQVDAWKQDLSQQLDQTINETAQLARQQQQLADRAGQQRGSAQGMQGEQGALQQGVQQAAERLEQAGRGSALLSPRSQRAMAEAQQRVQQATRAAGEAGQPGGSDRAEGAMRDAADALNRALASMVRDRERVNNANSASGFSEMLEQMKQLAQQQGSVNGQMQGLQQLLQQQGANGPRAAQQQARAVARQQREVAEGLQDVADLDPTGRLEALAREAQQVAQALDRGGPDPSVAARQQQLYRRLLDAGRFMEQEERDDQGPRESRAGDGRGTTTADGPASGKAAQRFAPPAWRELSGLSAEERRIVYEYFRRLNGSPP